MRTYRYGLVHLTIGDTEEFILLLVNNDGFNQASAAFSERIEEGFPQRILTLTPRR